MITISDLAELLNRRECDVVKMLKKRNYLKQNGKPTKNSLENKFMNDNCLITKKGENWFIESLGIKHNSKTNKIMYCPNCKNSNCFIIDGKDYTCVRCGALLIEKNGKLELPACSDEDLASLAMQVPVVFH